MKTIILVVLLSTPLLGFSLTTEKAEFKVYGACGMCKARIEKAAMIDGVKTAEWSQKTSMLTITYESNKVDLDDIHKSIAEAGHDTEKVRAKDETYKSLHACCHYERKEEKDRE